MIVARVFDMVEGNDGSYFIGFHPGPDSVVFRSTDGGLTWEKTGTLSGAYEALCLLRASDGTIYAGTTPNGDVFKYITIGIEEARSQMSETRLEVNPNPFRNRVDIRWQIADSRFPNVDRQTPAIGNQQSVSLKIYDATGRLVRQWDYQTIRQSNQILWHGDNDSGNLVPSGIYFCCLSSSDFTAIKKLTVIR